MRLALLLAFLLPSLGLTQARDIEQALIQRDRQSAEFSRPELRDLHLRQDLRQGPLRPDERVAQAREREAFPSPNPPLKEEAPAYSRPLPLPGGPRPLVEPIPLQGAGG